MSQKYYDPRAALNGTRVYPTHRQTSRDEALAAEIGQQIIFYTWLAGLTAIMVSVSYIVVKKIVGR